LLGFFKGVLKRGMLEGVFVLNTKEEKQVNIIPQELK